jgi:hypothetical protein
MSKVEKTQTNMEKCSCPGCPSYNECSRGKAELLFCADAIGKSSCPYPMNGCICMPCVVHQENDLKSGYYCIHGSADKVDEK